MNIFLGAICLRKKRQIFLSQTHLKLRKMSKAEELAKYRYPTTAEKNAFIDGYEQAEENLELTWEDMFDIFRIVNEVLDDYSEGKTKKEVGEEVLKRFLKERKEK